MSRKTFSFIILFFGFLAAIVFLVPMDVGSLMSFERGLLTNSEQVLAIPTEPFAEIEFTVTLPDPTATNVILMAIPTSTPLPTLVVTADVLHLRSCPDLDCEVLDWLHQGETLVWSGECSRKWAHVMLHNGWVYSIYVAPDVCQ